MTYGPQFRKQCAQPILKRLRSDGIFLIIKWNCFGSRRKHARGGRTCRRFAASTAGRAKCRLAGIDPAAAVLGTSLADVPWSTVTLPIAGSAHKNPAQNIAARDAGIHLTCAAIERRMRRGWRNLDARMLESDERMLDLKALPDGYVTGWTRRRVMHRRQTQAYFAIYMPPLVISKLREADLLLDGDEPPMQKLRRVQR